MLFFALPAMAADPALMGKLSKAEKDFFFQTYETQPLKDRVERLEKRILGSAGTGDIDQRLSQVLSAVSGTGDTDYQLENSTSSGSSSSQNSSADSGTESNTMLPSVRQDDNNNQDSALSARDAEISNLMAEGVSLWRNKNLQDAIAKFEQVIRLDANNAEAYFSMGVVSESRGELKKALAYYSRAQELDPKKREYKQASVLINKKLASGDVAELDSESQELLDDANEAFQNKEYLSALDMYKRLEVKKPKVASYKYNIGTIYLLIKNPFQALEYYKLALKLKPDEPKYQNAYQRVLSMTKAQGNPNDNIPQQNNAPSNVANKPVLSDWNNLSGAGQNQNRPQQMPQQMNRPMQQMQQQMPPQQFQQMPQQMQSQQFQQMPQQQFNPNQNNFNNSMAPGMVNQNQNQSQNRPNQMQMANNQFNQQNTQNPQNSQGQNNFVRPPHMGNTIKPQGGNQKPQQNQNFVKKGPSGPGGGILFGIGLEAKAPFPGAGLEVVSVMNHSRAQKAGILPQDCIMAVEGVTVQSVDEANKILTGKSGDQPITIILKRGNRIGQLSI